MNIISLEVNDTGEVNPQEVTLGNRYENNDAKLKFTLPSEYDDFHKYLIFVDVKNARQVMRNRAVSFNNNILPIENNELMVSTALTWYADQWYMYVMARQKPLDLEQENIDLSPREGERVSISSLFLGIVQSNHIDPQSLQNAPLDSNLVTAYDELIELKKEVEDKLASGGFDGFSPKITMNKTENSTTITVTDKDGSNTVTILDGEKGDTGEQGIQGPKGDPGEAGQNGYSPVVEVSAIDNGHKVSITDVNGLKQFDVLNGARGERGEQGIQGPKGDPGEQGLPGKDGADGADGTASQEFIELAEQVKTDALAVQNTVESVTNSLDKITQNENQITELKQDLTKCMIRDIASGNPTIIEDSADWLVQGLNIYGQSEQNGTPTPDTPIPIINKEVSSITVVGDDEQKQEITLSQPITLCGIPVSNNGNVVINGQPYMSDCINLNKMTHIQTVISIMLNGTETWSIGGTMPDKKDMYFQCNTSTNGQNIAYSQIVSDRYKTVSIINNKVSDDGACITWGKIRIKDSRFKTLEEFKAYLQDNNVIVYYVLEEPTITPIELNSMQPLTTYYPNTTINSGAWNEVAYIADPKLYIDKKLGALNTVQSKLLELESKV